MVMPAGDPAPRPDPNAPSELFAEVLGKLFGTPAPKPAKHVTPPKDSPEFIQSFADKAARMARGAKDAAACGCVQCALCLFYLKVEEFVCSETVAAAHTGDTSKLQALVDLIEQQRKTA